MSEGSKTRSRGNAEIVRVAVTRRIELQGPKYWVEGTLRKQLAGTIKAGDDRFIIAEPGNVEHGLQPDRSIVADMTINEYREQFKPANREQKHESVPTGPSHN